MHTRNRVAQRITRLALIGLIAIPLAFLMGCRQKSAAVDADQFTRLTNLGKSQMDSGDPAKAVELFRQALALNPTLQEAQLNLANALLLANQPDEVIQQANQVLQANRESAAAYYLVGCAYMRLGQAEEALKAFEQSHKLDPAVTALNFQLGLAHERLGHNDEALEQYQLVIQFEPDHPAASYRLSQLLLRLGRQAEADEALKRHQAILQKRPNSANDVAIFERCKHTAAKLPFKLEQPALDGIKLTFVDATSLFFSNATSLSGPLAVLDLRHDGRNSLFVRDADGFQLLLNSGGRFVPQDTPKPVLPGANYVRALVGDLQNDQTEDVVLLSDKGCQIFKFSTNGIVTDISRSAGFAAVPALDGALVDFDYTGKLGFLALQPDGKGLRAFRNLSSTFAMYFSENNVTSGLPSAFPGGQRLVLEDWNNDELLDVTVTRANAAPQVFARERGGPFIATNLPLPTAALLVTGDLNNDALPDAVAAGNAQLEVAFGGGKPAVHLPLAGFVVNGLSLVDYDNDGWLDIVATGAGLRVWRNLGEQGFRDVTTALGLNQITGNVQSLAAADFDGDCDTDLVVAVQGGGVKFWRNDGGNTNHQLKLRLMGHRSNASALGVRYEVSAGGLRAWRTVKQLPIEIGVGKHDPVDSVAVRWFDGFINHDDLKVVPCQLVVLEEIEKPTGSCPYLYSWNGQRFQFVTDLLGASPLGLRVTDTQFIDADPREYVHLGDDNQFRPRGSNYVLQITEELREVLYLDEAKLVVVEHPAGTEVHSTGKLLPGRPFPAHELVTLHHRHPLLHAQNHEGTDVTRRLLERDGEMVSPTRLRARQLRGLAEPHSVTLDFGPLATDRPLVLALTGWLRFGGGMANVGAAHTPDLPFPFPTLQVENAAGIWQPVEVAVGAPAGKTKTILVDLAGKLPTGSRRLRLNAAFELHWDRMALFEKRDNSETRVTRLTPTRADLHWRGYSEMETRPWTQPLTPDYSKVKQTADWTITPSGWCTRYGLVNELIAAEDNALALLNGGDELTLQFPATAVLSPGPDMERDFFLYTVGWDKDADFHCELGYQVEPLPWHGMDDQRYGHQPRPPFSNDAWFQRFNTRWVGPQTLVKRK